MARDGDHSRETPESLREKLNQIGISRDVFTELCGVNSNTMNRWNLPEEHPRAVEPPYMVTVILELLIRFPGALTALRELHEATRVSDQDDHASETA